MTATTAHAASLAEVFTLPELVIAWIVTFAAGVLQGVMGFGFNLMTVPVLTIVDPAFTPIPQLILSLPMTIAAAWRERDHLDTAGVGWVVAGRVPGSLVGAVVLTIVAERVLGIVIAAIVLVAIAAIGMGLSVRLTPRNRVLAGLLSGFTGTTAAIGGPPLALLYRDEQGGSIRSNLGLIFTVGLSVSLASLAVAGAFSATDAEATAWLVVPMLAGYAMSGKVRNRLRPSAVRQGILVISGVAAAILLVQSLIG